MLVPARASPSTSCPIAAPPPARTILSCPSLCASSYASRPSPSATTVAPGKCPHPPWTVVMRSLLRSLSSSMTTPARFSNSRPDRQKLTTALNIQGHLELVREWLEEGGIFARQWTGLLGIDIRNYALIEDTILSLSSAELSSSMQSILMRIYLRSYFSAC